MPAQGTAEDGSADPAAGGLRHAAAIVDSERALLDAALPYLDEGLSAGELTVLSCSPDTAELLRRQLGAHGPRIAIDPGLTLSGARPPDIFAALRRYALRAADGPNRRVRVVAEVGVPPERRSLREEMRVEAVSNRVVAELPVTTLCVYDSRLLPGDLVASARDTHPELVRGTAWSPSPQYREPSAYVRALPWPREAVEDGTPVFTGDDVPTLPELRHQLGAALAAHVPDPDQRDDLHLAVSEVAANAFRHGRPPVSARLWSDGREMVCTITDHGRDFDDPLAGFVPAHGFDLSRGGMGLWLARKLWDHVDLLRGPRGLTVRLSTGLLPAAGAIDG